MSKIDYTKFSKDGKEKPSEKKVDKRWWLVPIEERHESVATVIHMLIRHDQTRQAQYQLSARLYGNVDLVGATGLTSKEAVSTRATAERARFNVVQSGIDTLVSKQAKNKPKPLFLTSGGDWKIQRKAKKLDQFVEGIFYENNLYALNNTIRRDAYIFGDGMIQVYNHQGRVRYDRCLPGELYVDWMEAFYGRPLQLHRVKTIDRDVLVGLFPEKKELILTEKSASSELSGSFQNVADQVQVIESWRLPSGPKSKDGVHSINIESGNLLDEKWEKPFFPFAQRQWCKRLYGHWAQGIPEQIQGTQLEMNKMLWVAQRSYHIAGTFKVWLKTGSKVPKEHINNEIGTIITGEEPPQYLIPPVLPQGFFERIQQLRTDAFDQIGISQLSAVSQKPSGLDSGKALREYNNIESDRFMSDGQAEEQFILDLARLTISCAREIYEEEGKFSVKVPGRKFIQSIDWKDIDLDDDDFVMKIFPVSSLPSDPAGRLQTIQEYIQSGMIDPITGRRLLDFPDLDQHESLANAQEDWINQCLEKIVDDGEVSSPDPLMKLDLAEWFTLMYYAQGQVNGLKEDRLEMLRGFLDQIHNLQEKAMQGAMAQAGSQAGPPGQGMPQANPMAPPQSDMIPNVPGGAPQGMPAMAGA